jgi:hypothetical protein
MDQRIPKFRFSVPAPVRGDLWALKFIPILEEELHDMDHLETMGGVCWNFRCAG